MALFINKKKIDTNAQDLTILQLFEINKIEIPRFCYHEKLNVAGNCRMCLIEVEGVKKPIAACALPISVNMSILANSVLVKKAREGILEFLLANHPLDCPICDQGGECDLQEQALLFGSDKGRFYEKKRSVINKDCGPFVKTIMTRCIHCTRCVRYATEVAGIPYLGVIGRGQNMEISGYLDKILFSEVSGNLIDLCPVGALTSKPYAFVARPWELHSYNTYDLLDGLCPEIRLDLRDRKVVRILPRFNNFLKETWISDKTRFSYDAFFINRLNTPLVFETSAKTFVKYSWFGLFKMLKTSSNLIAKKNRFVFLLGDFLDLESSLFLKKAINKYGNALIFLEKHNLNYLNCDFRNSYLSTNSWSELGIYKNLLLFNVNLRYISPLLNIQIKQLVDKGLLTVYSVGENLSHNYSVSCIGKSYNVIINLIQGKFIKSNLMTSKEKLLIFTKLINAGFNNVISVFQSYYSLSTLWWNIFFIDHSVTSTVVYEHNLIQKNYFFKDFSAKDIVSKIKNFYYAININQIKFFNKNLINSDSVIYQGHHLSPFVHNSKFIFPSKFFLEKNSLYFNILFMLKKNFSVLNSLLQAKQDLLIFFFFF